MTALSATWEERKDRAVISAAACLRLVTLSLNQRMLGSAMLRGAALPGSEVDQFFETARNVWLNGSPKHHTRAVQNARALLEYAARNREVARWVARECSATSWFTKKGLEDEYIRLVFTVMCALPVEEAAAWVAPCWWLAYDLVLSPHNTDVQLFGLRLIRYGATPPTTDDARWKRKHARLVGEIITLARRRSPAGPRMTRAAQFALRKLAHPTRAAVLRAFERSTSTEELRALLDSHVGVLFERLPEPPGPHNSGACLCAHTFAAMCDHAPRAAREWGNLFAERVRRGDMPTRIPCGCARARAACGLPGFARFAEFMKEHGVNKPKMYSSWDEFIWF